MDVLGAMHDGALSARVAVVMAGVLLVAAGCSGALGRSPTHVVAIRSPGTAINAADLPIPTTPAGPPAPDLSHCDVLTPGSQPKIQQGMDGRLSGCVLVGDLAAGDYTLGLQAFRLTGPGAAGAPPGLRISLSPTAGLPGTVVTVTGSVAKAPDTRPPAAPVADVCWDGCAHGLTESQPITWNGAHFTTSLIVPAVTWLATSGPRPPKSGTFPITLQCLQAPPGPAFGCGGYDEVSEPFTLVAPSPGRCNAGQSCGELSLSVSSARPGSIIQVSGWAPLTEVIGQPYGYALTIAPRSAPFPPEVVPNGGDATFNFSPTPFTVDAAVSWASVQSAVPNRIQTAGLDRVSADEGNPAHLAYCDPSGIVTSRNSGSSWAIVPIHGVDALAERAGYPLWSQLTKCVGPVLDPRSSESVYAAFVTNEANSSPPPEYESGYETLDGGRTWRAIPVPVGTGVGNFGGLTVVGNAVEAFFFGTYHDGDRFPPLGYIAEITRDGGRTWSAGRQLCPASGACVTFGAAALRNCAGVGSSQPVVTSPDEGVTWSATSPVSMVSICDPASLAGLSDGSELLLGGGEYSALLSADGGRTWQSVNLPALPWGAAENGLARSFPGLTALDNGRLLAWIDNTPELLLPSTAGWCRAAATQPPIPALLSGTEFQVVGPYLWWFVSGYGSASTVGRVPLSSLTCA